MGDRSNIYIGLNGSQHGGVTSMVTAEGQNAEKKTWSKTHTEDEIRNKKDACHCLLWFN